MFHVQSGKIDLRTPVMPERSGAGGAPVLLIRDEPKGKVTFACPVTNETTVNGVRVWTRPAPEKRPELWDWTREWEDDAPLTPAERKARRAPEAPSEAPKGKATKGTKTPPASAKAPEQPPAPPAAAATATAPDNAPEAPPAPTF